MCEKHMGKAVASAVFLAPTLCPRDVDAGRLAPTVMACFAKPLLYTPTIVKLRKQNTSQH